MDMSSLSTNQDTDRHISDSHENADVDDLQPLKLDCNHDIDAHELNEHHDDDNNNNNNTDDDDNDDDDDDFTFVFIGEDEDSSIYMDKAFEDGQMFPLFDQKLLLDGAEYEVEQIDHHQSLPFQPPVNKVFTHMPPLQGRFDPSKNHAAEEEEEEDAASGPFCAWSKDHQSTSSSGHSDHHHHHHHDQQLSKKSNSTGFSKLWRLREKVHRSNSDGRDAFVFLKSSDKTTSSSSKAVSGDHGSTPGSFVKVNNGNGATTRKAKVVKKTTISAHEAYMRSRGGHTEEERRKSYLPYRPELMGFFTNVHGGLSKNVHPY